MVIHSKTFFYKKSNSNFGIWEYITTNNFWDDVYDIKYNSAYGCYTMYSYECELYYSKDLKTWSSIYGDFIYNPINQHYYKVTSTKVDSNYTITIAEMTALNTYGTAITLESIPYGSYASAYIYNVYKLGNYYMFPYSVYSQNGSGSSSTYTGYQRLAYTTNFQTWNKTTLYSCSGTSTANDQIRPLGSSGSKFVLFSDTEEGYRPVTVTSPTKFTNQAIQFTAGNMTADTGAYINGVWYVFAWSSYPNYVSTNGTTFTACPTRDYWKNQFMLFYQNHYITSNSSTGGLRVYDSSFTTYTDIEIPCDGVKRILGLMDNQIYIFSTDSKIFRTDISNLFN